MEITLKVSGMTCAMCVKTIERALRELPGVKDARANIETETVLVNFDESKVSLNQIIKAIENAGYTVVRERKEAVLKIGGMTCAMCARTIETGLKGLPGVLNASVNLGTERAMVSYDPSVVNTDSERLLKVWATGSSAWREKKHTTSREN